jgi:AP-3 complex subunit mu
MSLPLTNTIRIACLSSSDYTLLLRLEQEIWFVGVCEGNELALFGVSVVQYIWQLLSSLLQGLD